MQVKEETALETIQCSRERALCQFYASSPLCFSSFIWFENKSIHWLNSFQGKSVLGICILLGWSPPFVVVKACRCNVYWRTKKLFCVGCLLSLLCSQIALWTVQQRVGQYNCIRHGWPDHAGHQADCRCTMHCCMLVLLIAFENITNHTFLQHSAMQFNLKVILYQLKAFVKLHWLAGGGWKVLNCTKVGTTRVLLNCLSLNCTGQWAADVKDGVTRGWHQVS